MEGDREPRAGGTLSAGACLRRVPGSLRVHVRPRSERRRGPRPAGRSKRHQSPTLPNEVALVRTATFASANTGEPASRGSKMEIRCETSQDFPWHPVLRFYGTGRRLPKISHEDFDSATAEEVNAVTRTVTVATASQPIAPGSAASSAARRLRLHRRSAKRTDRIGRGDGRGKAWQPQPRRH